MYGRLQARYALPLLWESIEESSPEPYRRASAAHFEGGPQPLAFWHRGDVEAGQENSLAALRSALASPSPNLEVDVIDFIDAQGERVGLLAHETTMSRTTGREGRFIDLASRDGVVNRVDPSLPPEPFPSVVKLFDLVKAFIDETGTPPLLSLDLKEDGPQAEVFGAWLGALVRQYGFEEHAVASSFYPDALAGYRTGCPPCIVGGLVYEEHWALQFLPPTDTSLDTTPISQALFFAGFPFRSRVDLDFVYIQDDVLLRHPDLVRYWREQRGVRYVAAFSTDPQRSFAPDEWSVLAEVDWLDLDPVQMAQYHAREQTPR